MPGFDGVLLFWNVKNVKVDLMVNVKWQQSAQNLSEKRLNNSLKDLIENTTVETGGGCILFMMKLMWQWSHLCWMQRVWSKCDPHT